MIHFVRSPAGDDLLPRPAGDEPRQHEDRQGDAFGVFPSLSSTTREPSRLRLRYIVALAAVAVLISAYDSPVSAQATGLVAAYGFEEGSGLQAGDASGNGRVGTIAGATWTSSGRFGGALVFDGIDDLVSVADTAALDLTT